MRENEATGQLIKEAAPKLVFDQSEIQVKVKVEWYEVVEEG